jgi:general secretion pathway protein G
MMRRAPQRGLTMLEIMIVIAILGLIMGLVVVPQIMGAKRTADIRIARLAVHKLVDEDYPRWALAHPAESCPPNVTAITANAEAAIDPWSSPYQLYCGASLPEEVASEAAASSHGPDREPRTEDDIRSW